MNEKNWKSKRCFAGGYVLRALQRAAKAIESTPPLTAMPTGIQRVQRRRNGKGDTDFEPFTFQFMVVDSDQQRHESIVKFSNTDWKGCQDFRI